MYTYINTYKGSRGEEKVGSMGSEAGDMT